MPLQAKLLRVIQDGVVRRVGSEQQDAVVDVRFISATNREPQEAVDTGVLRGDLFYRLRVVPIKLPPLRKRPEDIPLLANHFLTYYWQRHRQMGDRVPRLSEASIGFLRSRPWRGNVRELQNVIEHVAVLAEPDQTIQPNDIPVYDDGERVAGRDARCAPAVMDEAYHRAKDRVVAQFEKEYLTRLVSRAGGNMSKAARLASIDRTTLYRLMDKHAFHRDETPGSDGVIPETAAARHDQRRAPAGRAGARRRCAVWDPDGPSGGAVAPALWDALREAVLWAQAEWERAVEHAAGHGRGHAASRPALHRHPPAGERPERRSRGAAPERALPPAARAHPRGLRRARAQALPAPDAGQLLRLLRRHRAGGPAARGRLVAALHRPALRARRPRAGGRGGARPALAAHLDSLPRRDAAAGPQRPGEPGAGAPARPHLQRRLRPQLGGERRDRAGPRRRPAGRPRPDPVLGHRHPRVGARHRPADRRGEEPRGPAHDARRRTSGSGIRWRSAGCCSTSPPTPSSSPPRDSSR